jgi:TatD DNase family protein
LPAAGLYPTILDSAQARKLHDFIIQNKNSLTAIGEVGLDYWKIKGEDDREIQREIFRSFIRLSRELDLPLNIHSRSAGRHAIVLLIEERAKRVQLHAFDGRASTAMRGVEAGFFFSIPPSVVRSRQKQKLVKQLPLECLLVETDSPVLGPDPKKRNEPANAQVAIAVIAEIKGLKKEKVAEIVYENTRQIYRLRR